MQITHTELGNFSIGQILDLGIRIYRRNFWKMTGVAALVVLPGSLMYVAFFAFFQRWFFYSAMELLMLGVGLAEALFLQGLGSLIVANLTRLNLDQQPAPGFRRLFRIPPAIYWRSVLASGALGLLGAFSFFGSLIVFVFAVSGGNYDVGTFWRGLFSTGAFFLGSTWASMTSAYLVWFVSLLMFLEPLVLLFAEAPNSPMIANRFLQYGAASLGVLCAISWGLFFLSRFSLVFPILVEEKLTIGQALHRSWQLTRGENKRAMFLVSVLAWLVFLLNIPLRATVFLRALLTGFDPVLLWVVAGQVSLIISLPLRNAVMAAYYRHLRVRKDGYDLLLWLEEFSPPSRTTALSGTSLPESAAQPGDPAPG